jgi:hypothetical protein
MPTHDLPEIHQKKRKTTNKPTILRLCMIEFGKYDAS